MALLITPFTALARFINYYSLFGIPNYASQDLIKTAYKRLANIHHPDANNGSTESEDIMKKVNLIYSILSNPVTKQDYDRKLANHLASQQSESATSAPTSAPNPDKDSPPDSTTSIPIAIRYSPYMFIIGLLAIYIYRLYCADAIYRYNSSLSSHNNSMVTPSSPDYTPTAVDYDNSHTQLSSDGNDINALWTEFVNDKRYKVANEVTRINASRKFYNKYGSTIPGEDEETFIRRHFSGYAGDMSYKESMNVRLDNTYSDLFTVYNAPISPHKTTTSSDTPTLSTNRPATGNIIFK